MIQMCYYLIEAAIRVGRKNRKYLLEIQIEHAIIYEFLKGSLSHMCILVNAITGEVLSRQCVWSVRHGRECMGMDRRLVGCASHHRETT